MTKSTETQNGHTKKAGSKSRTILFLKTGDRIPDFEPRRYTSSPYVVLRWRIGKNRYCEITEHRVKGGLVVDGIVHHKNENKQDNADSNLKIVKTTKDHLFFHRNINREKATALYKEGKTTTEVAKAFGTHPGNVSRYLSEYGAEARFGKGKPATNRIITNDESVIELLKKSGGNVLEAVRVTGLGRMVIRRIQKEHNLPRLKGKPKTKIPEKCIDCGVIKMLLSKKMCNACYLRSYKKNKIP